MYDVNGGLDWNAVKISNKVGVKLFRKIFLTFSVPELGFNWE